MVPSVNDDGGELGMVTGGEVGSVNPYTLLGYLSSFYASVTNGRIDSLIEMPGHL